MTFRMLLGLVGILSALAGCPVAPNPPPPLPPDPLEEIAAHHNQYVGNWEAMGALPHGGMLHVELAAAPISEFTVRFSIADDSADVDHLGFDLDTGILSLGQAYGAVVGGTELETGLGRGVPSGDGVSQLLVVEPTGQRTPFEVAWTHRTRPLGDDNRATISDRTPDCNVTPDPVTFGFIQSHWDVPDSVSGSFSVQASISQTDGSRFMYFSIPSIPRGQQAFVDNVSAGARTRFPSQMNQLNYSQKAADGTTVQWTARAGTLVIDAVDGSLPGSAFVDYDTSGKVTFYLEGIRMEPSSIGAIGSFTLGFSGTTTVGYKRRARP